MFQTWVLKVRKAENFETTGQWVVTTRQDGSKTDVQATYDFVLVCNGHYYEPKMPTFPSIETFKGTILHTHDYKDFRGFENKRVLVIGIGNSAADVACELSHHASHVSIWARLRDNSLKRACVDHSFKCHMVFTTYIHTRFESVGAQWLSGRVLDSRPRGHGFEPHLRHCVVVLEHDTFILA